MFRDSFLWVCFSLAAAEEAQVTGWNVNTFAHNYDNLVLMQALTLEVDVQSETRSSSVPAQVEGPSNVLVKEGKVDSDGTAKSKIQHTNWVGEALKGTAKSDWVELVPGLMMAVAPWAVAWQCLYWLCRWSAPYLFETYQTLDEELGEKGYWAASMVSTAHGIIIIGFVIYALKDEPHFLTSADFFMATPASIKACIVFLGYILSDGIVSAYYGSLWSGWQANLMHHVCVILAWSQFVTMRCGQLLALMGMFCEITTPFVNNRWFLDKSGMKSTWFYYLNGIAMIVTFFIWRIVLYFWVSLRLYEQRAGIMSLPPFCVVVVLFTYGVGFGLQALWFRKMMLGLFKMLQKGKANNDGQSCDINNNQKL